MAQYEPIRVLVTGAGDHMSYVLCGLIASGQVFGPKTMIILHLFDKPENSGIMEGMLMELYDCAYVNLKGIVVTCDPVVAFQEVSYAILSGGASRKSKMQRRDLLAANLYEFKDYGRCLDTFARKDVKVTVMTNPRNTLAYVCSLYAPSIPKENITALSRLDHNRAIAQISNKMNVSPAMVRNVVIWGNHSDTMFPDGSHALVSMGGMTKRVVDVVDDDTFIRHQLIEVVANRGASIIAARKSYAGLSAAKAAADHLRDWHVGTPAGSFVAMSVFSDGTYGAPKDVFFSFPVEISKGKWTIVKGLKLDEFIKNKIDITGKELVMEKAKVSAELEKDNLEL